MFPPVRSLFFVSASPVRLSFVMSSSLGGMKWSEVDYDDDGSTFHPSSAVPSSSSQSSAQGSVMPTIPATIVSKADASGVRTIVEYGTNEKGQKVRITRKMRTVRKQLQANKRVLERQQWRKFGDCEGLAPGPEPNVTYTSIEVINLDLRPKKREEEKEESGLDKLAGSQASIVVCRNCGETGHWTLKCPKRSEIKPFGDKMDDEKGLGSGGGGGGSGQDGRGGDSGGGGERSKYVPMHLRAGAAGKGESGGRGDIDDSCSLRVTNLSEECTEADLSLLFRRFGHTQRIYLAKDRQTGVSRGFAFVSYTNRHDAQQAINKLNGYGYDNLILHVEWAKPRENRPEQENESIGGGGK